MTIKLESAKDSGRSFGEPKVTVYEAVVNVDGTTQVVDCFTNRVLDFVGKELPAGATITPNKNPQYHPKLNIPKEGGDYKPIFGGKKPFTPSFKDSKEAVVLSAKTMVLSYCKDLAVAYPIANGGYQGAIEMVKLGFNSLLPLLDLDKLPEPPKMALESPTGGIPAPSHPALKPALVNILKEKFKGWHSTTIVKFVGALGFELPHNKETGDIFWDKLIEEEANTIINEMNKQ